MIDSQMEMLGGMNNYSYKREKKSSDKVFDQLTASFDKVGESLTSSVSGGFERALSSIEGFFNRKGKKENNDLGVLMGIEEGILSLRDIMWQGIYPRTRIGRLKRKIQMQDLERVVSSIDTNTKTTVKMDQSLKDTIKDENELLLKKGLPSKKDVSSGFEQGSDTIYNMDIGSEWSEGLDSLKEDLEKISDLSSIGNKEQKKTAKRSVDYEEESFSLLEDKLDDIINSLMENSSDDNDKLLDALESVRGGLTALHNKTVEIGDKSLIKQGVINDAMKDWGTKAKEGVSEIDQHFKNVAENYMLSIGTTYEQALELQRSMVEIPKQLGEEMKSGFMGINRTVITTEDLESAMVKAIETGAVDPSFLRELTEVYAKAQVIMPKVDLTQYDFVTRSVALLEDGTKHMQHIMTVATDLSQNYFVNSGTLIKAVDDYYYSIATMTTTSEDFMKVQRNLMSTTAALEDSFLNASEILKQIHDTSWKPISQVGQQEHLQFSAMNIDMMEFRKLGRMGDYASTSEMLVEGYRKVAMDSGLFNKEGKFVESANTESALEYMVGTLGMDLDKIRLMMHEGGNYSETLAEAFKDTEILLDPDRAQEHYLKMLDENIRKNVVGDLKGIYDRAVYSSEIIQKMSVAMDDVGFNTSSMFKLMAMQSFFSKDGLFRGVADKVLGSDFGKNLTSRISGAFSSAIPAIRGAVMNVATKVMPHAGALATGAGGVASGLATGAGGVASGLAGKAGVALVAGKTAIAGFLASNPIGWVIAGVVALGVAIYALVKNWDKIKEYFKSTFEPLRKSLEGLKQSFQEFWGSLKEIGKALWGAIKPVFQVLGFLVKMVFKVVVMPLRLMFEGVKNIFKGLSVIAKVVTWVVKVISAPFKAIAGVLSEAFQGVRDAFGGVIQAFKDAWASIKSAFAPIMDLFKSKKEGPGFLVSVLTGLGKVVGWMIAFPLKILASGLERLAKFIGWIVKIIKKPIDAIVGIVTKAFDTIKGIIESITDWVKSLPGIKNYYQAKEAGEAGGTGWDQTKAFFGVDYKPKDTGFSDYGDSGVGSYSNIDRSALVSYPSGGYDQRAFDYLVNALDINPAVAQEQLADRRFESGILGSDAFANYLDHGSAMAVTPMTTTTNSSALISTSRQAVPVQEKEEDDIVDYVRKSSHTLDNINANLNRHLAKIIRLMEGDSGNKSVFEDDPKLTDTDIKTFVNRVQ